MSGSGRPRVVLLAGRSELSAAVYHALTEVADVALVIEEDPPSKLTMVKRRAKRLGVLAVVDQLLFIGFVSPLLKQTSAARVRALIAESKMSVAPMPDAVVRRVSSVNDASTVELLRAAAPDVVVVNGTRIIARRVLESVGAPFINTHVGITPAYRGVHGAYWALAEGKPDLAGVTVHYVDAGIDTGAVIAQARIDPGPEDSFWTYPALQLAAALPLLKRAVVETHHGGRRTVEPLAKASRLYYHPGLSQYLLHWIRDGVR